MRRYRIFKRVSLGCWCKESGEFCGEVSRGEGSRRDHRGTEIFSPVGLHPTGNFFGGGLQFEVPGDAG